MSSHRRALPETELLRFSSRIDTIAGESSSGLYAGLRTANLQCFHFLRSPARL
jgi:hypothetical protein